MSFKYLSNENQIPNLTMKQMLHILNGDSTLSIFKTQQIPGDTIVWREVLCEGPATFKLGSNQFWDARIPFFQSFFNCSLDQFKRLTIAPFEKLKENLKIYDEIVLWFEYDLFCQINMMGLIAWLDQQKLTSKVISLICVGSYPGQKGLKGLAEIPASNYPVLFEERTELKTMDLFLARVFWKVYCSRQHRELIDIASTASPAFPYLEDAIRAHYQRFPAVKDGLNEIELFMLNTIAALPQTTKEIIRETMKRPNFYGFGDTQYLRYFYNLKPLIRQEGNAWHLNDLGEQVLLKQTNFLNYTKHEYWYGGASHRQYRWVPEIEDLVSVEIL